MKSTTNSWCHPRHHASSKECPPYPSSSSTGLDRASTDSTGAGLDRLRGTSPQAARRVESSHERSASKRLVSAAR